MGKIYTVDDVLGKNREQQSCTQYRTMGGISPKWANRLFWIMPLIGIIMLPFCLIGGILTLVLWAVFNHQRIKQKLNDFNKKVGKK